MKRLFILLPSLLFGLTAQTQNVVDLPLLIHDSIVVGGSLDYLKETRDKIDQLTEFPCDIMGDTIWGIEIFNTSPWGDCDLSYWTNNFVI